MNEPLQGTPERPQNIENGENIISSNTETQQEYETSVGASEQISNNRLVDENTESPSMLPIILMYGAVFAGIWFIMIRPQRRREKKMKEIQAAISVGDNIVTSGGLFGKVAEVGDDCFVVEFGTNRGVRIPVLKADVVGVRSPNMTPQPKEES